MTIPAEQAERIRRLNESMSRPVALRFVRTKDERSSRMESFLETLIRLAPRIETVVESGEEGAPPALYAGSSLCFHAVPEGGELAPFLDVLSALGHSQWPGPAEDVSNRIGQMTLPADLRIFVTPHCAFCPQVLKQVLPLALVNPLVRITVIDGVLFPEMASEAGVRSVPTVILDDRFRWTGSVQIGELVEVLLNRDPAGLSAATLKAMLKEGDAEKLARMMLDQGLLFPAFLELVVHPDWSVRLGAAVVVEEIAEQSPELARELLEPLWARLHDAEVSVKGDIIYLLGSVGTRDWIPRLGEWLAAEVSEEVREVATEAIEKLQSE